MKKVEDYYLHYAAECRDNVDTYGSYECRGRNWVADAKLSEHGKGNAIDGLKIRDLARLIWAEDFLFSPAKCHIGAFPSDDPASVGLGGARPLPARAANASRTTHVRGNARLRTINTWRKNKPSSTALRTP
jgi:Extensin-like protein C-terminus